jgi:hypothetical protein
VRRNLSFRELAQRLAQGALILRQFEGEVHRA